MKKYISLLLIFLLGFILLGCNNAETTSENLSEDSLANLSDELSGFSSYDDLASYFSELSTSYRNDGYTGDNVFGVPESTLDQDDSGEDTTTYSETNVQVAGIAEMDSIITDGHYIYMAKNQKLRIIDVDSMTIIFENVLERGYYQGLFLYNDKLVTIYNQYQSYTDSGIYGMYDYWWGYSNLNIDVLDVSDKASITVERELSFVNAYLTDVRMIDGQVYLMMTSYQYNFYAYAEDALTDDVTDVEQTTEENLYVPMYKDSAIQEEFIPLSWSRIYYFPENEFTSSYLLIGTFSVEDEEPISIDAYLGYGYEVYMNAQNLYIAGSQYIYNEEDSTYTQLTNILRFEVSDHQLVFKASNQIEGWTLNQFSFDEYDGVLRVATTIHHWDYETWETEITNQLYLLDSTDSDLTLISTLSGLGKPNERIYSVRMSGDTGYVVTFVNTDPLYKLDLSDPENPEIIGELYEEGVSDYLHPLDNDLMIGIGRQAVTMDGFTRFTGVKVALYDVSGNDPVALQTVLVAGEYSYSPATYNHKLFVEYNWGDTYLFSIPVYGYNDDWSSYYQAIYIYEVDGQSLTQKAVLVEENDTYYWGYIEKAIFINDSVYTISYAAINEYDMSGDFELVNSIELESFIYDYENKTTEPDEEVTTIAPETTSEVGDVEG